MIFRWLQFPRALVLVFSFSALSAEAASPHACQEFLLKNSPRLQCGSTCVPHVLLALLEMHAQKPLSLEYALLNQIMQRARSRFPRDLPAIGSQTWANALFALAYGGVQSEEEFTQNGNLEWWNNLFHTPMSEESLLKFEEQAGDFEGDPWWHRQEIVGRSLWRELRGKLRFRYLTSDFAAYFDLQRLQGQMRGLGLDIRFEFLSQDEIEIELYHELSLGLPVAVIMAPSAQRRHVEIALRRLPSGDVVTRNTSMIRYHWFWERPAPRLVRSEREFRRKLVGTLIVEEK